MRLPSVWPVVVKRGNSVVRIYKHTNRKGDQKYDEFKVASYDLNGKRKLQTFSDYDDAKSAADGIAASFASGDVEAITLKSKDAAVYTRAMASLKSTGSQLDVAASEYAKAWQILNGTSLVEAARYFAKKHPSTMPRKSVQDVVTEFLEAKQKANKSDDYLCDLRFRCGAFAKAFACCILEVTARDIREWLESLGVGARSQNNYRRAVSTLFRFAKKRGYLPKDHDELDGVDRVEVNEGEITIFTAAELREIINRADSRFVPFIVIGAFAGLRSKEIERLDWREVNLAEGHIEVKAKNAKTKSRRLVPIPPNLAKWLVNYAKESGSVVPFDDFGHQIQELCAQRKDESGKVVRPPFKWKTNALRHSFISYRMASVKNEAQVSLEAGNSPQMIFRNYRQLVSEKEAKIWFSIEPERSGKIVPLRLTGGSQAAPADYRPSNSSQEHLSASLKR